MRKFPTNEEDWIEISKTFEKKWNFPHCLGTVDIKHIEQLYLHQRPDLTFIIIKDFTVKFFSELPMAKHLWTAK